MAPWSFKWCVCGMSLGRMSWSHRWFLTLCQSRFSQKLVIFWLSAYQGECHKHFCTSIGSHGAVSQLVGYFPQSLLLQGRNSMSLSNATAYQNNYIMPRKFYNTDLSKIWLSEKLYQICQRACTIIKLFTGHNCFHTVVSQSVCHCQPLPSQSRIWWQGKEPTHRLESQHGLHLARHR